MRYTIWRDWGVSETVASIAFGVIVSLLEGLDLSEKRRNLEIGKWSDFPKR